MKNEMKKTGKQPANSKNKRYSKNTRQGKSGKRETNYREAISEFKPEGLNDFSWYNHYPELTQAAARIPFPYRPGMTVLTNDVEVPGTQVEGALGNYKIPGIMSLRWLPSIGYSAAPTDPASIIGAEMYAQVRNAYSGTLRADAPDYVIYMLALDSIYSYIGSLKRVYRILNAWGPDNYAVPNTLLTALGFSSSVADALRANKADLWQAINELIHMSNRFRCPAIMDIMNRHYWMNDNVYTDTNSVNSQMYCFTQHAFLKYTDADPENPGLYYAIGPQWSGLAIANAVQTLFAFGRDLIDALAKWDDSYTINGYLQRAFEGTASFTVAFLEQDERFQAVYEPEVLAQIENSKTLPSGYQFIDSAYVTWYSADTPVITQNVPTNSVVAQYPFKILAAGDTYLEMHTRAAYTSDEIFLMSSRSDSPTAEDVIIASRLKAGVINLTASGEYYTGNVMCATEIPLFWSIDIAPVQMQGNILNRAWLGWIYPQLPTFSDVMAIPMGKTHLPQMFRMMMFGTQFDWCPIAQFTCYINGTAIGMDAISYREIFGDVHNLTSLTLAELKNIHKICVYSEFNAFRV